MTIATYPQLVAAVGDWLDRDDLSGRASTFVQLAEARMNRLLNDPEMEVTSNAVALGGVVALPPDFGEMVSITAGEGKLAPVGAVEFTSFRQGITGTARFYTISDGSLRLAPAGPSAPVTMVYRRRIPALSDESPTNWLLSLAPDAYLYGSLVQAEAFLSEDERVEGWKSMFEEALAELRVDGARRKWGAGTLAPRIARP